MQRGILLSLAMRSRKAARPARPSARNVDASADPSVAPEAESRALSLWIQPRAASDAVVGERDGMVAIRLQAPPVDGAANAALIRFLARCLGCPAATVQLLRGERGRRKWVAVAGLTAAALRDRLLRLAGS